MLQQFMRIEDIKEDDIAHISSRRYTSGPIKLEKQYNITGISREYRFPGGLSAYETQCRINSLPFCDAKAADSCASQSGLLYFVIHDPQKLVRMGMGEDEVQALRYGIDQAQTLADLKVQQIQAVDSLRHFTDEEKKRSEQVLKVLASDPENPYRMPPALAPAELEAMRVAYMEEVRTLWAQLKRLNPELRSLPVKNDADTYHAVHGAISCMNTDDIRFYLEKRQSVPAIRLLREMYLSDDKAPSYFISDRTLLTALKKIYPDITQTDLYKEALKQVREAEKNMESGRGYVRG